MTAPAHLRALTALIRAKVDFLLIGALALDHFVPEAAAVYATLDCDILLRPTLPNVRKAYRTLVREKYALSVGGEPLVAPDELVLRRILEYKITARAERADSLPIDMLVEAKGFVFEEWWAGRTHFKVGRIRVPCASLEYVLESKRQAGRDKDKKLLALYETAYKPLLRRRRKTN